MDKEINIFTLPNNTKKNSSKIKRLETTVNYLKCEIEKKFEIHCQNNKIIEYADVNTLEKVAKKFHRDSNYNIIFLQDTEKDIFQTFTSTLTQYVSKNKFLLVFYKTGRSLDFIMDLQYIKIFDDNIRWDMFLKKIQDIWIEIEVKTGQKNIKDNLSYDKRNERGENTNNNIIYEEKQKNDNKNILRSYIMNTIMKLLNTIITKINCRIWPSYILLSIVLLFCSSIRYILSKGLSYITYIKITEDKENIGKPKRIEKTSFVIRSMKNFFLFVFSFQFKFFSILINIINTISLWISVRYKCIFNGREPESIYEDKPSGLKNTKETCYMNSMIQALASSNKLNAELIKNMSNHPSNETFTMFLDVIKGINEPSSEDRVDKNTKRLITFMNKVQWDRTSQQDAFQLLSHFINAIQKKQANGKDIIPPKFKILHTFSEDPKFNKIQDHLALPIPCGSFKERPGEPLKNLLDLFFESSKIEDGPYGTQMFLFEKAPEVLILHIQANEWDYNIGNYIKPKYYIKYEMYLDYTFKVQKKKDGSESEEVKVKYELMAVVHHMGSISGGHYITYRRHGEQWYLTNDEQVEKVPFNFAIVPYIMVYEKKDEDVENDMELC